MAGDSFRVVTLNLWGIEAPLERRLDLAIRQLRALAPDAICLQEARPLDGVSGRTTADVIGEALDMTARYAVSVSWKDGEYAGQPAGQEGLAIIAKGIRADRVVRLPQPRAGEARILLTAHVDTAGGPIWLHTTHLHYRLDDGVAREQQVMVIDDAIRALGRDKTDAPQVLCGDFNATPDSDEIRFLRGLHTLGARRTHFQDAWLRLHAEPGPGAGPADGITWSSENEMTRALRSLDIDRRLDYIFVTDRKKDGRGTIRDCRVVLTERDGADSICASDHYGVMADIQIVAS